MTRRKKITFAAGATAIAVLVVGLGAAGAVAASSYLSPDEESKAIIDEAVEAGRLTEEQGAELKERIDSDDHPLLLGPGKHSGPDFGHHVHFMGLEAAASYLGMTEAELRDALQDSTLAEIAREQGKAVTGLVKAIVADKTRRIDEAVADGRLTEEQGSDLKARLTEHVEALVNGELPGKLEKRPHELWRGSFSPRAPPLFRGSSA
jgi:polyhydroxyalkanoate synthesis regulator phasin